jgi:nucleolar protein 56
MGVVAPNLSVLVGDAIGARLISKAGSLANLCKYPASTVQILGAEKALFRALKTKGKTPKYGLIYNASFVGKAGQRDKGRISRLLANKCSMAARIDHFSQIPTTQFGEAMKRQVEERLAFYSDGTRPSKNIATMVSGISFVQSHGSRRINSKMQWTQYSKSSRSQEITLPTFQMTRR